MSTIDLLCIGHACYDLIFAVDHQPAPDEKDRADAFVSCGGGTAANGAVTAAMLGVRTAFAGYLGQDIYGDQHLAEFHAAGVDTCLVVRGRTGRRSPRSLSSPTAPAPSSTTRATPTISLPRMWTSQAAPRGGAAGRPPAGAGDRRSPCGRAGTASSRCWTRTLSIRATWSWCAAATSWPRPNILPWNSRAHATPRRAWLSWRQLAPTVIVTLGERGLIWRHGGEMGVLPAFSVPVVDTTGAGDTFHGALAAGLAQGMAWLDLLRYASAAGALCCTKHGARLGIPSAQEVADLLSQS